MPRYDYITPLLIQIVKLREILFLPHKYHNQDIPILLHTISIVIGMCCNSVNVQCVFLATTHFLNELVKHLRVRTF